MKTVVTVLVWLALLVVDVLMFLPFKPEVDDWDVLWSEPEAILGLIWRHGWVGVMFWLLCLAATMVVNLITSDPEEILQQRNKILDARDQIVAKTGLKGKK